MNRFNEIKFFFLEKYFLTKNTLKPRFESELIVEKILEQWKLSYTSCLDIGTGSGCLIISVAESLKHLNTKINFTGIDISKLALKTAFKNKNYHQCNNIKFIKSDLFNKINKKYDVFISNPPYINPKLKNKLNLTDPYISLYSNINIYRKLFQGIKKYINHRAYIEICPYISKKIIYLLNKFNFRWEMYKDYNNLDRYIILYLDYSSDFVITDKR